MHINRVGARRTALQSTGKVAILRQAGNALIGGIGSDRFVIGAGRGSDEILDYADGIDGILLEGGLTFEQLTLEASGNATQVKLGDEVLVTVLGVNSTLLDAADFSPLP